MIQAVLLFGADSWVLLDMMIRTVDSTHVDFLRRITGKQERFQADGSWETPAYKNVIQAVGMKTEAMYKFYRQAKVVQWVDLQTLLEVCIQETSY